MVIGGFRLPTHMFALIAHDQRVAKKRRGGTWVFPAFGENPGRGTFVPYMHFILFIRQMHTHNNSTRHYAVLVGRR